MRMMRLTGRRPIGEVDSAYAWLRLLAGVLTSTIGGVGMWSIAVVLPTLQADFAVTRADVSLSYTAVMLGAVVGGPVMGWLSDRFGITVPVAIGTAMLALGLALASQAATMWQFTPLAQWVGWRRTYFGIAVFCICSMLPLLQIISGPSVPQISLVEPALET